MAKNAMPVSKAKTAYGLLSEVCALIKEEPLRYDQCRWIQRVGGTGYERLDLDVTKAPSCGTVGCVAGWVGTLKRADSFSYWGTELLAMDILGLDGVQAYELFNEDAAGVESQSAAHAKRGIAHIRKFQKKYAKQLKAKRV